MRTVRIFDTTLRDGEQTPGVSFHTSEKVEVALGLEQMGVDIMEVGFPAASRGDFRSVEAIAKRVRTSTVCALARCVPGDVAAAAEALRECSRPRIHVFIATSPIHMRNKLNMSAEEVLEAAVRSVRQARTLCDDIQFGCEDATRSDREFLARLLEYVIREGAGTITLPDTVGYAGVTEYGELFSWVREHVTGADRVALSAHCHNDLGLAVANSLEAVRCGADQVECTVNGLGERTGNAAMEEIVMGLRTRRDFYRADTGLNTRTIYQMSRMIAGLSGIEPAQNKPVVGGNAFRHASGIHQHGMLADRMTYEIMDPLELGIPTQSMSMGKLSGSHALAERANQLGYDLKGEELKAAFARFKELADKKKEITDRDILAIIREQMIIPEKAYHLISFQVFSGNRMTSTATVTVDKNGEKRTEAAWGEGPVEACFNAVDAISGMKCSLESYNLKAVTEGQDALGEVTVRVRFGEDAMLGRGVSTDVLEASCLAYLNAVNRLIRLWEVENGVS